MAFIPKDYQTFDEEEMGKRITPWILTATADNTDITLTKSGVSGASHYIVAIYASYSGSATKLMILKDGTNVIGNFHVINSRNIEPKKPIKITPGNDVSVVLPASGTAGVIGALTVIGFTL